MMKSTCTVLLFMVSVHAIADPYQACVPIESRPTRLDCYDRVAAEHGPIRIEMPVSTEPGVASGVAREKEPDSFGMPPERTSEVDSISATVVRVEKSAFGKLVIYLDNDQVWHQLDTARLPLREGERVIVRTAALGSHLLEKEKGSRKVRIRRIE